MKQILIIAALFITFSSQAQTQFGIKAGADLYNFTGRDAKSGAYNTNKKFKAGLIAGIFIDEKISKILSIQPGLFYSEEGNMQKDGSGNEQTYKLNYLNLPVVLKYNSSFGFFGEAGFQAGYLLTSKQKTVISGISKETTSSQGLNDFVYSSVIGCGWKFKNGFGINARSQWGFTPLSKSENITNSGFYASVFFQF